MNKGDQKCGGRLEMAASTATVASTAASRKVTGAVDPVMPQYSNTPIENGYATTLENPVSQKMTRSSRLADAYALVVSGINFFGVVVFMGLVACGVLDDVFALLYKSHKFLMDAGMAIMSANAVATSIDLLRLFRLRKV